MASISARDLAFEKRCMLVAKSAECKGHLILLQPTSSQNNTHRSCVFLGAWYACCVWCEKSEGVGLAFGLMGGEVHCRLVETLIPGETGGEGGLRKGGGSPICGKMRMKFCVIVFVLGESD